MIWGFGGDDRLDGGSGADMVGDFADGDVLHLEAFELDGFAELKALCSESSAGLKIDLPGADAILLSRRSLASLSPDDALL